jgi:putative tricarboxylic transport membrane protein
MRSILVASGLLFVLALAYWLGADAIPKSSLSGSVGADGLPKLLAVTLGVLSVALAGQTILEARKRAAAGKLAASGGPHWRAHARAFGVIAIGAVFIALLPVLGYVVTVGLLLVGIAIYSGKRPDLWTVVFGVVGAVVFYVLFVHLLRVPLPPGLWASLLA